MAVISTSLATIGLLSLLIVCTKAENALNSCHHEWELPGMQGGVNVNCIRGSYVLPDNFDVSAMNEKQAYLSIAGRYNVVKEIFLALPARGMFRKVKFANFNELPEHGRFPLNQLLVNNRQIQDIELDQVKLVTLTAADFEGFSALNRLSIKGGQITEIALDIFGTLSVAPDYVPSIRNLHISDMDQLLSLDWGFLKPLSENLEAVTVTRTGVKAEDLTCSVPFTLKKAKLIKVSGHKKLHQLPAAVLETFNTKLPLEIDLSDMPFCTGHCDCSCCDMYDLSKWLQKNNQQSAVTDMTCGCGGHTNSTEFLAIPDLHENCKQSYTGIPSHPSAPVQVKCVRGVLTKPTIELEDVESTRVEFIGDQTRQCLNAAYDLHTFLLKQEEVKEDFGMKSAPAAGVTVTCTGRGDLEFNERDPEMVDTSNIYVETANTVKCREFFFGFLKHLLAK